MGTVVGLAVECKYAGLGITIALAVYGFAPPQDDALGRQAQAILAESCSGCHGPGQQLGNLRLDTGIGRVVIAGKPAESLLLQRVNGALGKPRMPMGGAPL